MKLAAALIYWIIILIWMTVLITVALFYIRNPRAFGTTRLLLIVIGVDTIRNVVENLYFGLYFGASYGLFPAALVALLGKPVLLILPKIGNVVSGLSVLGLLLGRWLPQSMQERRALETTADGLRERAAIDGMTGLFNRTHFLDLADAEFSRFQRHKCPLALLMVDIDQFKSINDRFGHDVGDRVIVQVAHACRDQKRKSDIAARLGGEEFALLLPETKIDDARVFAERLRSVFTRHVIALTDVDIAVSVSIGISGASDGGSLADLLKEADRALYQAKREGRDRVCSFDATTTIEALPERALPTEMPAV